MIMRIISILTVWLLAVSVAFAQDEPLPESVTAPYLAYEAAVEAGDAEAAASAAEQAWRASEGEALDPDLKAILAENAAYALARIGQTQSASEAIDRAIHLQEQSGANAIDRGMTYRLASELAYQSGDMRQASRLASRALDLLEDLEGEAGVAQRFGAYLIRIQAEGAQGRFDRAAHLARQALEEGEGVYDVLLPTYGLPAFYMGAKKAYDGREGDAAYWFAVSYALLARLDYPMTVRDAADAWGDYLREDMPRSSQQRLLERLIESGYLLDPDTEAGLASVGVNPETPEGFVGARALRRVPPEYPDVAAQAGVEGFALVRYDVNEVGQVENAEVIFSLPYSNFGDASLEALDEWEFEPATQDGVIVPDIGRVTTMEFKLAG